MSTELVTDIPDRSSIRSKERLLLKKLFRIRERAISRAAFDSLSRRDEFSQRDAPLSLLGAFKPLAGSSANETRV